MSEVFPTPLSPKMMILRRTFLRVDILCGGIAELELAINKLWSKKKNKNKRKSHYFFANSPTKYASLPRNFYMKSLPGVGSAFKDALFSD
jgi:hypothetical protein